MKHLIKTGGKIDYLHSKVKPATATRNGMKTQLKFLCWGAGLGLKGVRSSDIQMELKVELLLLHLQRSLLVQVFCLPGERSPFTRRRTCRRDDSCQLAWESFGTPLKELVVVTVGRKVWTLLLRPKSLWTDGWMDGQLWQSSPGGATELSIPSQSHLHLLLTPALHLQSPEYKSSWRQRPVPTSSHLFPVHTATTRRSSNNALGCFS